MAKNVSKKSCVKASSAKLSGKPPPGDKTLGLRHQYASMLYKTLMIIKKDKKHKYLSSMTQALQNPIKTL